jgi:FMN phosphatase YigB (HAD superfamily)
MSKKLTLISDLGEVIVRLDFSPIYAYLEKMTGRPAKDVWPLVHEEGGWRRLETGDLTIEEYAVIIGKTIDAPVELDEFQRVWCSVFPGIDEQVHERYLKWRSEGRPLVALSNTNAPHMDHMRTTFDQLSVFDHIYTSHEIGARKPDRECYEHVLAQVDTPPEDCIFIDDRQENIDTANQLGLHTVLACGGESVCRGLDAIMKKASL